MATHCSKRKFDSRTVRIVEEVSFVRIARFSIGYLRQRAIGQRRVLNHIGGVFLPLIESHGRIAVERNAIRLGSHVCLKDFFDECDYFMNRRDSLVYLARLGFAAPGSSWKCHENYKG